jgi:hypothetical protein
MREASVEDAPPGQIVFKGDGNVLGDVITIHQAPLPVARRSDRRTRRVSAINFIRSTCRRAGDPLAWLSFARTEFGATDLEELTDLELERVRGWCAALEEVERRA